MFYFIFILSFTFIQNFFCLFNLIQKLNKQLSLKNIYNFSVIPFNYQRDKDELKKIMHQNVKELWNEPCFFYGTENTINGLINNQIEIYKELLEKTENNKIFVKRINNKTIGFIFYKNEEKIFNFLYNFKEKGSIEALAIDEEYKKNGYGKDLLNFAINDLSENKNIDFIEVLTTNKEIGKKFYENFGFHFIRTSYNKDYGITTFKWRKFFYKIPLKIKFIIFFKRIF